MNPSAVKTSFAAFFSSSLHACVHVEHMSSIAPSAALEAAIMGTKIMRMPTSIEKAPMTFGITGLPQSTPQQHPMDAAMVAPRDRTRAIIDPAT
eukprot:CAMPEP_0169085398 /NCGR_PEP_ID=MMETSP1015-20121227/13137_1 /TAXON_ID=342587 /ORGANISM="Karlodinium micrum, Strain CCMP2283" /LENGTH=93 /DNA_ID=CAMNT_0009145479 /DNA_START=197 /DNA_END=474 /DNA_ORIENTATION=+